MDVPLYMTTGHVRHIVGRANLTDTADKVWFVTFDEHQTELNAIFADKWLGKDGFDPTFEIVKNTESGLFEVDMVLPQDTNETGGTSVDDNPELQPIEIKKDWPFSDQARMIVYNYVIQKLDKSDGTLFLPDFVYTVWSCKTLQNWKALCSTSLPDGMYYEVTYNGDKQEAYLDVYKKFDNVPVDLSELYLSGTRLEVAICGECEHKVIAAKGGTAEGSLKVCTHLDDSVISLPGTIEIVSANTGQVLFTFEVPSE